MQDAIKMQKSNALAVQSMIDTVGWRQVIKPELDEQLRTLVEKLIVAKPDEVTALQAEIQAIRAVTQRIEDYAKLVD